MQRFHIRINYGDNNITKTFYFVHSKRDKLTPEEIDEQFDKAVQEINKVYKNYGRFATAKAVVSLFNTFGFEETIKS